MVSVHCLMGGLPPFSVYWRLRAGGEFCLVGVSPFPPLAAREKRALLGEGSPPFTLFMDARVKRVLPFGVPLSTSASSG